MVGVHDLWAFHPMRDDPNKRGRICCYDQIGKQFMGAQGIQFESVW